MPLRNVFNTSCPNCEKDVVVETFYAPSTQWDPEEREAWIKNQACKCDLSGWEKSVEFYEAAFDRDYPQPEDSDYDDRGLDE